jgi:hypothetical protein
VATDCDFSFSPLPTPAQISQQGSVSLCPPVSEALQKRYNDLPKPDTFAQDLFDKLARPCKAKVSTVLPAPSTSNSSTNPQAVNLKPASAALPEAKPPVPEVIPPAAAAITPDRTEATPGKQLNQVSSPPEYLTPALLQAWQRSFATDNPTEWNKTAASISAFMANNDFVNLTPPERKALTALVIQMLQSRDNVVREIGLAQLNGGRVKFNREESRQLPYRELSRVLRQLKKRQKDALYPIPPHQLAIIQAIQANWAQLTTQAPALTTTDNRVETTRRYA